MGKGLLPSIKGVFLKKIERFYCKNVYLFCFFIIRTFTFYSQRKTVPLGNKAISCSGPYLFD